MLIPSICQDVATTFAIYLENAPKGYNKFLVSSRVVYFKEPIVHKGYVEKVGKVVPL